MPRYLAYYSHEDKRHATMLEQPMTIMEAQMALSVLASWFEVSIKEVRLKFGAGASSASTDGVITFSNDMLNWLTLAHEFAHLIHFKHMKWGRGWPDHARAHDCFHATLTDWIVEIIKSEGWAK